MSQYNIIVSTAEATVVSEYEPQQTRSDAYQSEAALEAAFIKQLTEQGYTYLQIHSSDELVTRLLLPSEFSTVLRLRPTIRRWVAPMQVVTSGTRRAVVRPSLPLRRHNWFPDCLT